MRVPREIQRWRRLAATNDRPAITTIPANTPSPAASVPVDAKFGVDDGVTDGVGAGVEGVSEGVGDGVGASVFVRVSAKMWSSLSVKLASRLPAASVTPSAVSNTRLSASFQVISAASGRSPSDTVTSVPGGSGAG